MCLLCKQLSHIFVLLHRKWLNLYAYVTNIVKSVIYIVRGLMKTIEITLLQYR